MRLPSSGNITRGRMEYKNVPEKMWRKIFREIRTRTVCDGPLNVHDCAHERIPVGIVSLIRRIDSSCYLRPGLNDLSKFTFLSEFVCGFFFFFFLFHFCTFFGDVSAAVLIGNFARIDIFPGVYCGGGAGVG